MSDSVTDFLSRAQALDDLALDDHIHSAAFRLTRARYELACLLAVAGERRSFRGHGCTSLVEYGVERHRLEPKTVRDLARLGRRLADLPELHAAFASGRLAWTKAREVARVATPETEGGWLDRAAALTSRELEREVAHSSRGDCPADPDEDVSPAPARVKLVLDLAATDAELLQRAIAVYRASTGDDAETGVVLADIARVALQAADEEGTPMSQEQYRVVVQRCPGCESLAHVGQPDGDRRVDEAVAEEVGCDAEIVDGRPGPAQWSMSRTIPPKVRRAVLHRDDYRCVVPGCVSRVWTSLHHLRARADGGPSTVENLVALCSGHHRALHEHRLWVERGTDGGLVVERAPARAPDDCLVQPLLELLGTWTMQESEIAIFLQAFPHEVREVMRWCERRALVVRAPSGGWRRLGAAASEGTRSDAVAA